MKFLKLLEFNFKIICFYKEKRQKNIFLIYYGFDMKLTSYLKIIKLCLITHQIFTAASCLLSCLTTAKKIIELMS